MGPDHIVQVDCERAEKKLGTYGPLRKSGKTFLVIYMRRKTIEEIEYDD